MPYDVTVNFNCLSFGIRFNPSWSIARRARFKAEIARKRNVNPTGFKIIFAGQEFIPDTMSLGVSEIIIARMCILSWFIYSQCL
jgi:hypothetical protein